MRPSHERGVFSTNLTISLLVTASCFFITTGCSSLIWSLSSKNIQVIEWQVLLINFTRLFHMYMIKMKFVLIILLFNIQFISPLNLEFLEVTTIGFLRIKKNTEKHNDKYTVVLQLLGDSCSS